jgi:peptidoglycan hydrolase-like protein with peptidoglycan-binding domain
VAHDRRSTTLAVLALVGVLGLTGCAASVTSAGDDVVESPSSTTPASDAPPASAATTTAPSTTATTSTTAATTTTTAAPTTTAATTTAPPAPPPTAPPAPEAVEAVVPPLQPVGTRGGGETARIQLRLSQLGFWLSAADGEYGLTTRQAVMAFEKWMGYDADGKVDQQTADALSAMTTRPAGRANAGTLVEVDKAKQLLFFVVDGRTEWILNVSTGDGQPYSEEDKNTPGETVVGVSDTPSGLHRVNRERPDGWWEGDLGKIYRPKYFVGGVAVHGSNSIPAYPASHGCVRVSVPAMDWIWDSGIMPMRTPVWVHG